MRICGIAIGFLLMGARVFASSAETSAFWRPCSAATLEGFASAAASAFCRQTGFFGGILSMRRNRDDEIDFVAARRSFYAVKAKRAAWGFLRAVSSLRRKAARKALYLSRLRGRLFFSSLCRRSQRREFTRMSRIVSTLRIAAHFAKAGSEPPEAYAGRCKFCLVRTSMPSAAFLDWLCRFCACGCWDRARAIQRRRTR